MVARIMPRARASLALVSLLVFVLVLPTLSACAAPPDGEAELRVAKTAYDDLRKNLYTDPDTVALLTDAQQEAQKALDQTLPLGSLDGDADAQWETFARNIRQMVAQTSVTTLATGDLAHRLIMSFAKTINDRHTYFIPKQQADATRREERGDTSIVNFGFVSVAVGSVIYVKEIIPHSPIDEAGAKEGDRVLTVDGQDLNADNRTALLGTPQDGQTYRITVQHIGDPNTTDLAVHLHRYTRLSLTSRVLDGHIGYIQTFAFYSVIPKELDAALADLHNQHVDSLILDVRLNGGGTAVDQVMSRFLPSRTELGVTKNRRSDLKITTPSDSRARETLPVVVLVDDSSASASEITALAFRDFTQATLIGTTTRGALGTTRRFDLGDGSLLSITTSVYTSAKGEALNKIGVAPDVSVDRTNDDVVAGRDPQLSAAIASANLKVDLNNLLPRLAAA